LPLLIEQDPVNVLRAQTVFDGHPQVPHIDAHGALQGPNALEQVDYRGREDEDQEVVHGGREAAVLKFQFEKKKAVADTHVLPPKMNSMDQLQRQFGTKWCNDSLFPGHKGDETREDYFRREAGYRGGKFEWCTMDVDLPAGTYPGSNLAGTVTPGDALLTRCTRTGQARPVRADEMHVLPTGTYRVAYLVHRVGRGVDVVDIAVDPSRNPPGMIMTSGGETVTINTLLTNWDTYGGPEWKKREWGQWFQALPALRRHKGVVAVPPPGIGVTPKDPDYTFSYTSILTGRMLQFHGPFGGPLTRATHLQTRMVIVPSVLCDTHPEALRSFIGRPVSMLVPVPRNRDTWSEEHGLPMTDYMAHAFEFVRYFFHWTWCEFL
jgi:hypothetical protein